MKDTDDLFFHSSVVMNTELMISADFIFDGLKKLTNVTYFQSNSESKIFTSYYLLSVGIERLQKVILSLAYNYIENGQKDKYKTRIEKAFYGHNHEELNNLLKEYTGINNKFNKQDNKFISQLMEFYNKHRYSKYSEETDVDSIYQFHSGHLNEAFIYDKSLTEIMNRIFESVQRILTSYFKTLQELQQKVTNFLGESTTDTKLFTIINYSKNLKKYFKLFYISKIEYVKYMSDLSDLDGFHYKNMVEIDAFFDGNGEYAVDWLIESYLTKNNLEYTSDIFYNGDEEFNRKNKITDDIINYYEKRNLDIANFFE